MTQRVIVFIDGFNLYFGMKSDCPDCKWLDVVALAQSLLKPGQTLAGVHYFTARVRGNPNKQKKQNTYLEALELTGAAITYGNYQSVLENCVRCGHVWDASNEKMTDVNIAVAMLLGAVNDEYDLAILISGDSDLVPPIQAVQKYFPPKRVIVAFPPNRYNRSVDHAASACFILGKAKLRANQLPHSLTKPDGFVLTKPKEWI